jgi:L-aminopeptidase/D-esterase-like protein
MSASTTLKPYAQLLIAGLIAMFGIAVGVTALGHAIDPEHVGLWSGPHAFFFGTLDGAIHAHQLPGSTLYLVALVVVALSGLICRELVGYARAGLARQAR